MLTPTIYKSFCTRYACGRCHAYKVPTRLSTQDGMELGGYTQWVHWRTPTVKQRSALATRMPAQGQAPPKTSKFFAAKLFAVTARHIHRGYDKDLPISSDPICCTYRPKTRGLHPVGALAHPPELHLPGKRGRPARSKAFSKKVRQVPKL